MVAGKRYHSLSEKDPARLPWGDLGVDIVRRHINGWERSESFTISIFLTYKIQMMPRSGPEIFQTPIQVSLKMVVWYPQQQPDVVLDAIFQHLQVVPTFQHGDEPA